MSELLQNFTNPFADLSQTSWYVLAVVGVLVLSALVLVLASRLKALPKVILAVLAAATLVLIVALLGANYGNVSIVNDQALEWSALSLNVGVVLVCVVLLVALGFLLRRLKLDTRTLVSASLCIALGFILSTLKFYQMPQGGSITPASMLPVMLFAWAFGPVPGIAAGVVYGALQLLQDFYVVHPAQLLLDYIFAFGALGLAGFFRKNLLLGVLIAGLTRFVFHFISGVVFFGSFAPAGQSVFAYSLVYNASVVLPDTAICLIIAAIPGFRHTAQRLFRPANAKAA